MDPVRSDLGLAQWQWSRGCAWSCLASQLTSHMDLMILAFFFYWPIPNESGKQESLLDWRVSVFLYSGSREQRVVSRQSNPTEYLFGLFCITVGCIPLW